MSAERLAVLCVVFLVLVVVGRPQSQVVPQQLHDQCGVLVGLLAGGV